MTRQSISIDRLWISPFDVFIDRWMLLTSGDFSLSKYNAMTVSWGAMGQIWERPFVMVVVRPGRYTFEFMERHDSFTLCVFPEKYRPVLNLLGSRSGRTRDKIRESGLTPEASLQVSAPCFNEAELVLECVKMYWDDIKPGQFLDKDIHAMYPEKDYHRAFFGRIAAVQAAENYIKKSRIPGV
jgi:flavin reductase (DIM6/NTAB) family NADH-FMN oxidoreductase RutF